jgi:hypothetical protein
MPEAVGLEVDCAAEAEFGAARRGRDGLQLVDEVSAELTPSVVELEAALVNVECFVAAWFAKEQEADLAGGAVRGNEKGAVSDVAIAERGVGEKAELCAVLSLELNHQLEIGHSARRICAGVMGMGHVPVGHGAGGVAELAGVAGVMVGPRSVGAIVVAVQT